MIFQRNNHLKIGIIGETIACKYLKKNSYKIIERNHRQKWGEIDIVAKAPDATLVFIEVKTLKKYLPSDELYNTDLEGHYCITPEENLTAAKLRKLQRVCHLYANAHPKLINDDRGWRIDLIAIDLIEQPSWPLTIIKKWYNIRQYENI